MIEPGFRAHHPAQIRRLGHVFYAAGLRMQRACAERVHRGDAPDQILVLEHNPVFTLGRNATRADIHVTEDFLAAQGVEVHPIDRGGQVTYHGPGQIVVYPVCNLQGGRQDLGRLVRGLEEAMIRTAGAFGVAARRLEGHPGVWVDTPRGPEKLGAVGLHVKRWITTHGIAFNVDPDLARFRWITPCGITDKGVCSLGSLLGTACPTWSEAAERLEHHLADVLALERRPVPPPSRSVSALTWRPSSSGPEVLLMLRRPDQGLWWSSVTGMVESGEGLEEAALRELEEEAGLSGRLRPLGLVHAFLVDPSLAGLPDDGELRFNQETCFQVEVPPGRPVHLNLDEHTEFRWCLIPEALDLVRWEGAKASLLRLRTQLEGPRP